MKEYNYCPVCGALLTSGVIEGKERKFCPNCDFVDYKNPLPVALAIVIKDKQLLLIKRGIAPRKGSWASPSGFIETGETAEEACLRELKEETGVSGQIVKLAGVARVEDKEIYGDMLIVMYVVKVDEGEPMPGDEVEAVRFFDMAELPDYYTKRFRGIIEDI